MAKRYDEDTARLCKAIREDDTTEALSREVGLFADFMNTQEQIRQDQAHQGAMLEAISHQIGMLMPESGVTNGLG